MNKRLLYKFASLRAHKSKPQSVISSLPSFLPDITVRFFYTYPEGTVHP